MRFRIISNAILVAIIALISLDPTWGYSRYSSSSSDLRDVREQLEILTNEVSRLAHASSPPTDDQTIYQGPITLVSVERVRESEVNIFTLNFTKNTPELYYTLSVYGSTIASGDEVGQEVNGTDGVSSLIITCEGRCNNAGYFDLYISDTNQSSRVRLQLDNGNYDPKSQGEFTIPSLVIEHDGDLVYEPRKDVTIKVSAPYAADRSHRFSDVRASFKVIDEDGWRFEEKSGEDWIEIDTRKYLEAAETTFTIDTSQHPLSGFLILSIGFDDSEARLVRKYEVERSIGLRPSNQRGPFPEDFLTFPGLGGIQGNLTTETMCQVGTVCSLTCSAIGGFMTDLQVNKLSADGDWERMTNISELVLGYYRKIEWNVQLESDSENMKFQCLAQTAVSNISRILDVIVLSDEFFIDENRTILQVQANETDPQVTDVVLNCTVVGRPVTEAYFSMLVFSMNAQGYRDLNWRYVEVERISLSRDETLLTATVSFDPSNNDADSVQVIYCNAEMFDAGFTRYNMFDSQTDLYNIIL